MTPMLHKLALAGTIAATLLGATASAALAAGRTERVSVNSAEQQGNNYSTVQSNQVVSGNGRYVVFNSAATNFGAPGSPRLYLRDRVAGTTAAIDFGPDGKPFQGTNGALGRLSRNARVVAFEAYREVEPTVFSPQVFARDLTAGATVLASVDENGKPFDFAGAEAVSATGRYVLFTAIVFDAAGKQINKLLLRDLRERTTTFLVEGSSPSMSGDARFIAYVARDRYARLDQSTIFRLDRRTGKTVRVTRYRDRPASGGSSQPAISDDGNIVAFTSDATKLVPRDRNELEDVFVRNVATGATERVSVGLGGTEPNGRSGFPSISADGRYVAFGSEATNLVAGDANGKDDIFVYDRQAKTTRRVDVNNAGASGNQGAGSFSISADGSTVAFESASTNLVPNDTNGVSDVFVRVLSK